PRNAFNTAPRHERGRLHRGSGQHRAYHQQRQGQGKSAAAGGDARPCTDSAGTSPPRANPVCLLSISRMAAMKGAPMPTAIDEFPQADYHFYTMGLQYYVAGRFGAVHRLTPVTGNLLHHAVEMVLKGKLAHHHSLSDLKKKFGHDLAK